MSRRTATFGSLLLLTGALAAVLAGVRNGTSRGERAGRADETFPHYLVAFEPVDDDPVFTAGAADAWDAKLRERGWIVREGNHWHLWYTGYDGTRTGVRQLGYATSDDGRHWQRHPGNPLLPGRWIEDMMVVKHDGTYYMFAEGEGDHAQWLTSTDRVQWEPQGTLDIRYHDGRPLSPGPFGTPTVWREDGTWYLFYERMDLGVWLATSSDLKVWTNVQDKPVLVPGPDEYDRQMIALNQVIKRGDRYYAYYHGSGGPPEKRIWNTAVATSSDLVHWQKYPGNPIEADKSSGMVLFDGRRWRLYTMHDQVDLYYAE